jgi:hypothetical protein
MKKIAVILSFLLIWGSSASAEVITIFDGKLSLDIPAGFTEMSPEEISFKFPRTNSPVAAYANEARSIAISITRSSQELKAEELEDLQSQLTELFPRIIPGLTWKANEIVEVNGKKWIHMEMLSFAVDTDIHNHMFMTELDGKSFGINLNAPESIYDTKVQEIFRKVSASFKITE